MSARTDNVTRYCAHSMARVFCVGDFPTILSHYKFLEDQVKSVICENIICDDVAV